ncbi:MAG: hypothetical protein KDA87_03095 [Planctomycetales bacterium]|nr:hypothetical protein [Planctomycetales bacterium]
MNSNITSLSWAFAFFACVGLHCSPIAAQVDCTGQDSAAAIPKKLDVPCLPNAVRVHERVISGGLPEGDVAFAELVRLGVRTVISVDGAKPDVATAEKHGLRYVHLPHGYDGISPARMQELAKAVRDLKGPIYIHCHHGRHRSPAAAAVACVGAGLIPAESAKDVLSVAGTSVKYRGLFLAADGVKPFDALQLDRLKCEFPAVAQLPVMAEAMVEVEHTHDRIKKLAASDWRTPADHPDLNAAHQALLLREHFTELLRTDEAQAWGDEFLDMLRDSEQASTKLEDSLERWDGQSAVPASVRFAAKQISTECKRCHERFRDVPVTERK